MHSVLGAWPMLPIAGEVGRNVPVKQNDPLSAKPTVVPLRAECRAEYTEYGRSSWTNLAILR